MIRVAWVRGTYLNGFEGQNYRFPDTDIHITGVSSLFPLSTAIDFPLIRLPSPADIPELPVLRHLPLLRRATKYIWNRAIGDSQLLYGLEKLAPSFDIFHTADPHYYYSYQLARLRNRGAIKALIMTSWETIAFNNESVAKKRYLKKFVMDNVDLCICYTERAADVLNSEGMSRRKIRVIPLGVDVTRFTPAKKSQTSVKTILYVGRLVEEKGIMDLYEAFADMHTPNVRLTIVGSGPLRGILLRRIAADRLKDVVSLEEHPYNEMHKVFQSADIFVLPSRRTATWEEQYGMVLGEAMASGLPVICTTTGAISEVVGDAAIQVEGADPRGLRKAIRHVLLNSDECDKRSLASRRRAEDALDSRKTAKNLGTIYSELYEKISPHSGSAR